MTSCALLIHDTCLSFAAYIFVTFGADANTDSTIVSAVIGESIFSLPCTAYGTFYNRPSSTQQISFTYSMAFADNQISGAFIDSMRPAWSPVQP